MGNTGQLLFLELVSVPACLGGFLGQQNKLNQEVTLCSKNHGGKQLWSSGEGEWKCLLQNITMGSPFCRTYTKSGRAQDGFVFPRGELVLLKLLQIGGKMEDGSRGGEIKRVLFLFWMWEKCNKWQARIWQPSKEGFEITELQKANENST